MKILNHLEPGELWGYFEEICSIPRISKHEEQILEYLISFARERDLEYKQDPTGNLLITKPAHKGFENKQTVILQSHVDMVGAKSPGNGHDWLKDPVKPVIRGEWVMAEGTTLGGDDGIGIAAQMAILADNELECGKIEALFTVDEETGMTGAIGMDPSFVSGRILLNLDSEDEGILFIGCAGGIDTIARMEYVAARPRNNTSSLKIRVSGLHGGHSGDEIHKGYGNAIRILNGLLLRITEKTEISLSCFEGGNLRNAIPREAQAIIVVKSDEKDRIGNITEDFLEEITEEYSESEPAVTFTVEKAQQAEEVMDNMSMMELLTAIDECPNGVINWSSDMPGLVETSTNLATIRYSIQDNLVTIATSQRSSVESAKISLATSINRCFSKAGMEVTHSDGYPGWKPDMESFILEKTRQSYLNLFSKEPEVTAIHAGLECGLFYKKIEDIDMISIGPTIKGAHTTEERIEIKTVKMFWDLLTDVLKNI